MANTDPSGKSLARIAFRLGRAYLAAAAAENACETTLDLATLDDSERNFDEAVREAKQAFAEIREGLGSSEALHG